VGAHELAPTPISLKSRELSVATIENTPIITAAALVTVARIPGDTAPSVTSQRSRPSRRPRPARSSGACLLGLDASACTLAMAQAVRHDVPNP